MLGRAMPMKVFLSYRIDDDAGHTQLIFERLQARLPEGSVFKDDATQRILLGENIQAVIEAHITDCDVVLAVIGSRWLELLAARAFNGPKDWVALELETALESKKRVVPVLVNTTPLTEAALPEGLRELAGLNAAKVDPRRFERDFEALFERLQQLPLAPGEPPQEPEAESSWAVATGSDAFGSWADIEVAEVRTRLRYIPPGGFSMGSGAAEDGRWADEGRHAVTLSRGYYLGEVPCTQALWSAVMDANPSRFAGAQRPVEELSWQDCASFCASINGHIRGLGARLPTEAEWEYACRAGSQASHHGSGSLDEIAWWHANSEGQTRPVRQKAPNAWGLHDMLGNVWEWCADWYGPYSAKPAQDPLGPSTGSRRVARGGAWCNREQDLRAALRNYWHDSGQIGCMGFRLARTARTAPTQV
jgi:formylglycine-generating enzyme required for sulfatase activity